MLDALSIRSFRKIFSGGKPLLVAMEFTINYMKKWDLHPLYLVVSVLGIIRLFEMEQAQPEEKM